MKSLKHICVNQCMFMKIPNNYVPKELIEDIKTSRIAYVNSIREYPLSIKNTHNNRIYNDYIVIDYGMIQIKCIKNRIMSYYALISYVKYYNYEHVSTSYHTGPIDVYQYKSLKYVVNTDYKPSSDRYKIFGGIQVNSKLYCYSSIRHKQDLIYKNKVLYKRYKSRYINDYCCEI